MQSGVGVEERLGMGLCGVEGDEDGVRGRLYAEEDINNPNSCEIFKS